MTIHFPIPLSLSLSHTNAPTPNHLTHNHNTHPRKFSPFLINDHLIQLWKSGQRGG